MTSTNSTAVGKSNRRAANRHELRAGTAHVEELDSESDDEGKCGTKRARLSKARPSSVDSDTGARAHEREGEDQDFADFDDDDDFDEVEVEDITTFPLNHPNRGEMHRLVIYDGDPVTYVTFAKLHPKNGEIHMYECDELADVFYAKGLRKHGEVDELSASAPASPPSSAVPNPLQLPMETWYRRCGCMPRDPGDETTLDLVEMCGSVRTDRECTHYVLGADIMKRLKGKVLDNGKTLWKSIKGASRKDDAIYETLMGVELGGLAVVRKNGGGKVFGGKTNVICGLVDASAAPTSAPASPPRPVSHKDPLVRANAREPQPYALCFGRAEVGDLGGVSTALVPYRPPESARLSVRSFDCAEFPSYAKLVERVRAGADDGEFEAVVSKAHIHAEKVASTARAFGEASRKAGRAARAAEEKAAVAERERVHAVDKEREAQNRWTLLKTAAENRERAAELKAAREQRRKQKWQDAVAQHESAKMAATTAREKARTAEAALVESAQGVAATTEAASVAQDRRKKAGSEEGKWMRKAETLASFAATAVGWATEAERARECVADELVCLKRRRLEAAAEKAMAEARKLEEEHDAAAREARKARAAAEAATDAADCRTSTLSKKRARDEDYEEEEDSPGACVH